MINQTSFWSSNKNDDFVLGRNTSIKLMIKEIKRLLLFTKRNQGWKNPKFHLLLHFIDIIVCYGAPRHYDSQCAEYNHKYYTKKPNRRSQKQTMLLNLKVKLLIE